jgi:hypothetical protein
MVQRDGRIARVAALLVAVAALGGCGDDGGGAEAEELPDCSLRMQLQGAHQASFEHGASWGCAVPFGPESGVWMVFLPGEGDVSSIDVMVDAVGPAQTGTFPAGVGVYTKDDRSWGTKRDDCTLTVSENVLQEEDTPADEYLMVGSGSCAAPALPSEEGSGEPIEVGAFEVRFPPRW